jgi:hypothetical protein
VQAVTGAALLQGQQQTAAHRCGTAPVVCSLA